MDNRSKEISHNETVKSAYRRTRYSEENVLHVAISRRVVKINVIKYLLAKGLDVNKKNSNGETAMHVAVFKKCPELEVIRLLLDYGADVKILDDKGNTPLHSAVIPHTDNPCCQLKIVKILLDAGVDINALNNAQQTAFSISLNAKRKINTNLIEELLKRGANFKLKLKRPPLFYAVRNKFMRYDIIKVLLDYGACVNLDVFDHAVKNPNCTIEIVEAILSHGFDVNCVNHAGYTSLHLSVMSAHNASIVETLLKWGAKANARTNFMYKVTPLHLAVRNEKCPLSVVEVLLRYGADTSAICSFGNTPLMLAAKYRDDKVLEELLVKGADPNQMSGFVSALHFAVLNQSSNANILKTLIQYGGNINIADPSVGITPLLYILRKDYKINQVKELLRNGATLQFADERLSPLRIVLKNSFFSMDTVLVIREILKYAPRLLYEEVLFDALSNAKCPVDVYHELIRQGANVQSKDSTGKTPLHRALESIRPKMNVIELFLKYEAWCTCQNLPWSMAVNNIFVFSKNDKFLKLLVKYATLQNHIFKNIFFDRVYFLPYPYVLHNQMLCESELIRMAKLAISNRKSREEIAFDCLFRRKRESKVFEIFEDDILKVLTGGRFPIYSNVIARKLKRSVLIEHALTRKIYTRNEKPYPHDIVLTADSVRHILGYLSNACIINLLSAFKF